jgi:hypothetical protein
MPCVLVDIKIENINIEYQRFRSDAPFSTRRLFAQKGMACFAQRIAWFMGH